MEILDSSVVINSPYYIIFIQQEKPPLSKQRVLNLFFQATSLADVRFAITQEESIDLRDKQKGNLALFDNKEIHAAHIRFIRDINLGAVLTCSNLAFQGLTLYLQSIAAPIFLWSAMDDAIIIGPVTEAQKQTPEWSEVSNIMATFKLLI